MSEQDSELFEFEPIKGYPELRWNGKRSFTGTSYYPAQLKETYGRTNDDGWINKLYWGDNLQVMSHLLKNYRGKVDLIYIDPPFDSKADYKKKITLRGKAIESDSNNFEEKQYGDIWTNDEYLQFMYERLILCKELLSSNGSIYLHCDWHRSYHIRCLMDEIFGINNARNEIIWYYYNKMQGNVNHFASNHDTIFLYSKTDNFYFTPIKEKRPETIKQIKRVWDKETQKLVNAKDENGKVIYIETDEKTIDDVWRLSMLQPADKKEPVGYPTQKPEALLERIINASSKPGDLVFDCFMGSGTTQAVAMKLGRRFIGADINLGAIQTTTKRLLNCTKEIENELNKNEKYTGFEIYNVNDYDFFRNELEAKKLIIDALGMQALPENNLWDAELDGRMVAILGINRIATASEFERIIANIDISALQRKQNENPGKPVECITFVCMGHDPNLQAMFEKKMESLGFKVDLQILDILRDKKELTFKRDADAKINIKNGQLKIDQFYPMNLLQKLSLDSQDVKDWKELVDTIMIDWNYDGVTFNPDEKNGTDIPDRNELVKGIYKIPENSGTIHIKITDLISESWEGTYNINGDKL